MSAWLKYATNAAKSLKRIIHADSIFVQSDASAKCGAARDGNGNVHLPKRAANFVKSNSNLAMSKLGSVRGHVYIVGLQEKVRQVGKAVSMSEKVMSFPTRRSIRQLFTDEMGNDMFWNIASSWKNILAAILKHTKRFTTSTETEETIGLKTYKFAVANTAMAKFKNVRTAARLTSSALPSDTIASGG
jgi:hypothetical protein